MTSWKIASRMLAALAVLAALTLGSGILAEPAQAQPYYRGYGHRYYAPPPPRGYYYPRPRGYYYAPPPRGYYYPPPPPVVVVPPPPPPPGLNIIIPIPLY